MSVEWGGQAQQGFFRTVEGGADPRAEFGRAEQPGGFDDAPLAMRPLGLDWVEPRALTRQIAIDDPHAPAGGFHLPIVRADPLAHHPTPMPRRIVPHQQQRLLPCDGQLVAAPRQKLGCACADGSARYAPQPSRLGAVTIRCSPADQQTVAGQRFRVRVVLRDRLLDQPPGLVGLCPRVQGRLRQAAPPHLILEPHGPGRMGGPQADQAIASAFFRAYSGSGLVIHRLARFQRSPKRAKVARIVSPLTRSRVSPCSKLTAAANSSVHTLVGFPKDRGLWCKRARSCSPRARSKATRNRWGREEPFRSAARPRVWNAAMALRTVWAVHPSCRAISGAGCPRALARRIWDRRWTKASAERKPASNWLRSASVSGRTYTGCFILLSITRHQRPSLRLH